MNRYGVAGILAGAVSGALVGFLFALVVVSQVQAVEGEIGTVIQAGRANYATIGGPDYLAIRADRGTTVKICGVGDCQTMVSTDYGPAKRTGDIADIALGRFARICGWTVEKARQMGECDVTIEYFGKVSLPATDTEWRGEWVHRETPEWQRWALLFVLLVGYVAFKHWFSRRYLG